RNSIRFSILGMNSSHGLMDMLCRGGVPRHSWECDRLVAVPVERIFATGVLGAGLGETAADDVADRDCGDERPGANVVERVGHGRGDQDRRDDADHPEELGRLEGLLRLVLRPTSVAGRRTHAPPLSGFGSCHMVPPSWIDY